MCIRDRYKAIERHEILLRNLNGSSLDEAIQAYTHFCDKKNYEKKLSTYKYAALSSLFIASIGLLIYINKKKKTSLPNCGSSPTNRNIGGIK